MRILIRKKILYFIEPDYPAPPTLVVFQRLKKNLNYTDLFYKFARIIKPGEMDTKLTLKLDRSVIEKAKKYAKKNKRSISRMIESYLRSLIEKDPANLKNKIEISPFVKSMSTGVEIPSDLDYKSLYGDHLHEKYQ